MILFAGVIAFGSVLNSSLIEIADRPATSPASGSWVLGGAHRGYLLPPGLVVFAVGLIGPADTWAMSRLR